VAKDRLSQDAQIHRNFRCFVYARCGLMMREKSYFGAAKVADSEVLSDERFGFEREGF